MTKKEKREERLIRGDELLEAAGVDLDAPDEELLPLLLTAIGRHPDSDLSVADLLGSIAEEESARRLVAWEESAPADKDLLRILRRSLFRLQQRGVKSALRPRMAPEPPRLLEPAERTGYLSPLDGMGNRLAWLARPRAEGGLRILSVFLNDLHGIRQIDMLAPNRNQLKEALADTARHGSPMAEAPAPYVDWLIWEAHRRGSVPEEAGGFPLLRAEFYSGQPQPVPNPVHGMIAASGALTDEQRSTLIDESATLFNEPEFASWGLPDDQVRVHQARFRDAQTSTLMVSQEAMTDRLKGIIDETFEEVFSSETRPVYASRMAEMALWYLLSGGRARETEARRCYAVHLDLADPHRSLRGVSFLRALVFRSFLHLMPRAAGESAQQPAGPPPLIIRPD